MSRLRLAAALVALLWGVAPRAARAGVSAQMQPGYQSSTTTSRDAAGTESRFDSEQWVQRYRLGVEQQLYPTLTFSAGGNLLWTMGSSEATGGQLSEFDNRRWSTFARLAWGGPVLNGGLDYSRTWDDAETRSGGITSEAPGAVREAFGLSAGWRPADLPSLALRLRRSTAHDVARATMDQTSDEATAAVAYDPVKDLSLAYSLAYGGFEDHITGVTRTQLVNSLEASWGGRFLEGRGNAYLGYRISARTMDTRAPDSAGPVALQQFPLMGFSRIEAFPDTPLQVDLRDSRNALLMNGDVATSAGINLGTAAGTAPIAYRNLGVQFQDVITKVAAIYVYVDRDVPADARGLFTWDVYQSSDNIQWAPVVRTAVSFNAVALRFELTIEETQARYLKVVTKPLSSTLTVDPAYREIFVTELQFYDLIPPEVARGTTSDVGGNLSATTRILLVPDLGFSYDFSGTLTHGQDRPVTWAVVNGLSLSRRLSPVFAAAARVNRSDSNLGAGHDSANRWSASLSANPLPTLGGLVSYSGQLAEVGGGTAISNSATLSARADLYPGLAVNGLATGSIGRNELDVTSRSLFVSASTSIVPNRAVSLSGSVSYTTSTQRGGGKPDASDRRGSVEAGASLSPFPALALSGSVSRQFGGVGRTATLASFAGAFSPFRGGDLQLRYGYQESLDVEADLRTRSHGPTARWNIRTGWYLDGALSFMDTSAPAAVQHSRTASANLLITFR